MHPRPLGETGCASFLFLGGPFDNEYMQVMATWNGQLWAPPPMVRLSLQEPFKGQLPPFKPTPTQTTITYATYFSHLYYRTDNGVVTRWYEFRIEGLEADA